jgi:hypothetical protein
MTKAREKGDNEFVEEAKRRAARTGRNIEDILREMLEEATQARDTVRKRKVQKAQKYLKKRNIRKRRGKR